MVWRLFCLATQRAAHSNEIEHGLLWSPVEAQEQSALADEAERLLVEGVVPTAHKAPSTAGAGSTGGVYRWNFHANALRLPIEPMLEPDTRELLIVHAASAIEWALASLDDKGSHGDTPFEWLYAFCRWLGDLLVSLSVTEMDELIIARLDAASPDAAAELMDGIMRHFMLNLLIDKRSIDPRQIEKWDRLIDWAIARPDWSRAPVRADEHERGMAVSSFLCAVSNGIICAVDDDWPNLEAVLPSIERGAEAFVTERTAFAAMLALLRRRPERLLPKPGLDWIKSVAEKRKYASEFWDYGSNGERLVLLLREYVAANRIADSGRDIIVGVADTLIEMGVKGAAFLQQDLARSRR